MKFINTVTNAPSTIAAAVNINSANNNYAVTETVTYLTATENIFYCSALAPFFIDGFTITDYDSTGNAKVLVKDVDFVFKIPFMHGIEIAKCGVMCAIKFLKPLTGSRFVMNYISMGGIFTTKTPYGSIIDFSRSYEENFYQSDYTSIYTAGNVTANTSKDKITNTTLANAIDVISTDVFNYATSKRNNSINMVSHTFNFNNPHNDNASIVNLDQVANYAPTTDATRISSNNSSYITPADLAKIISSDEAIFASISMAGLLILNTDEVNLNTALTAVRLLAIRLDPTSALNYAFGMGLYKVVISPSVIAYPCTYDKNTYASLNDLLNGIANSINLRFVNYNSQSNAIYIPADMIATVSSTITLK